MSNRIRASPVLEKKLESFWIMNEGQQTIILIVLFCPNAEQEPDYLCVLRL